MARFRSTMMSPKRRRRNRRGALSVPFALMTILSGAIPAHAADYSSSYTWAPVRLGAGGLVSGFVTHPQDANVRYCRTDVGNAYRWDSAAQEWLPMVIRSGSSGLPYNITRAPQQGGVISLGIDPNNKNIVYMAYKGDYSDDVRNAGIYPGVPGSIYKSTDGGKTFTGSDLNVPMSPNSDDKFFGERITVDPNNASNVWFGSEQNGLWRSVNGGANWVQVSGNGAPAMNANITRILFSGSSLYVVPLNGSVYRSDNGGANWYPISGGQGIDGKTGNSAVAPDGSIYLVQNGSRYLWKYSGGNWQAILTNVGWSASADKIAIDANVRSGQGVYRVYVVAPGGAVARTDDDGANWNAWGPDLQFAGAFSWLPQPVGWRNCGAIAVDSAGTVWIAEGNEGVLRYTPNGSEGWNTAKWTIDSKGIEEFVSHDVIVPPGGHPVMAVEDSTALYVSDPSQLTAKQATLQDQLISNGTGLAYCPNASNYVVCATADCNHTGSGKTYSGYSNDGGQTWTNFGSEPSNAPAAGSIAVSRRNGWGLGGDHLVALPSNGDIPYWSNDGGNTWHASSGFPANNGYWNFSLKQRELKADPFVADKFYCEGMWYGGFYVSTDGGQSWQIQPNAGLPQYCHHGQLEVNRAVQNDLWFCDGWQNAGDHGLWHSTNGGQNFGKIGGIDYALTLTVGAGRGQSGDAPYTVYFYGKRSGDDDWGVFRSTDGGASWDRVSYYPYGLVDEPTCMAASWDTFGTVYIGFNGNSFVYGTTGSGGGTGGSVADGTYTITARYPWGKALEANSSNSVYISTANGSAAQQWQVSAVGNGRYKLINAGSGSALDVLYNNSAPGTQVDTYTYFAQANQQWSVTPTGDGYYYLVPGNAPGQALDISGWGTADGTGVDIYTYGNQANQQWQFNVAGNPTNLTAN